jgi:hypothetical protein
MGSDEQLATGPDFVLYQGDCLDVLRTFKDRSVDAVVTSQGGRLTEREFQTAVIEAAQLLGWRVAHFRPAQTAKGWRTPVEADGAGFPDLVMIRRGHLIFAELKSTKGMVRVEQQQWLDDLLAVSVGSHRVQVYVWRPVHWLDGTVLSVLKATGVEARVAA